ncbi:hypothetical protein GM418_24830 [Maribellus comscasis]|uniref:Branched chain amino acid aminotransferase n=1 Tax=Maribellus comscasis TaxID=2681766 RepID=A0A6I6K9J1_9BACT|nr:hypothetical protein [Maribellus comscasis]QGY46764.1 hypothetical protein GM418_24830 [Maribellus comscasis]
MNIAFTKTNRESPKPDFKKLGFGKYFAEYMFEMDYSGNGWENPQIKPYDKICIEPSTMVFHYGQSVFEGLKAYLSENDEILLFRPEKNIKRLNKSSERLCIPALDEKFALKAIVELVKAQTEAKKKGCAQVLWLDGVEQKYIEEVGTMKAFLKDICRKN